MSSLVETILDLFRKKAKKVKIICCGLDAAGKTTIINHLKPKRQQKSDIVPTVGFSVENFTKDNLQFTVFDMSGQGRYRNLWESFYQEIDAIVFVIDSSERLRLAVAKNELDMLLNHSDIQTHLQKLPILFFANKQDLQSALSAPEISNIMSLDQLKQCSWTIVFVFLFCTKLLSFYTI